VVSERSSAGLDRCIELLTLSKPDCNGSFRVHSTSHSHIPVGTTATAILESSFVAIGDPRPGRVHDSERRATPNQRECDEPALKSDEMSVSSDG
jgi:hypothetical protein